MYKFIYWLIIPVIVTINGYGDIIQTDVTKVINKIEAVQENVRTVKSDVKNVSEPFIKNLNQLKSLGIENVFQDAEIRYAMKDVIKDVLKRIKSNVPSSDFDGNIFKDELMDFLNIIEETSNALILLGESESEKKINLQIIKNFINESPDTVLYPLSVVFNETNLIEEITTQLAEIPSTLVIVNTIVSQDRNFNIELDICSRYKDNKQLWKGGAIGLTVTGYSLKGIGVVISAIGKQLSLKGEAGAAAGGAASVGLTIKIVEAVGDILQGLSIIISGTANSFHTKIATCDQVLLLTRSFNELNTKIDMHDQKINATIDKHDQEIKELLNEIIRLQLTPHGLRRSSH